MRLIDADALSDIFETKVCRGCSSECVTDEYGCGCSIHYMKELLWQQPTAYDMDKVVEELEKEQEQWLRGYNQTVEMGIEHLWRNFSGRVYGVASAIDIVKRGGVDD